VVNAFVHDGMAIDKVVRDGGRGSREVLEKLFRAMADAPGGKLLAKFTAAK